VLTLLGNITSTTSNLAAGAINAQPSVATLAGAIDLGGAQRTFDVAGATLNGQLLSANFSSLSISAVLSNGSLLKTGNGFLNLSGQNTFAGGLTVASGGLILGASSTLSPSVLSGPVGIGTLTLADATTLAVNNANRTLFNPVVFQGSASFETDGVTAVSLTLNGPLTLPGGVQTIAVNNPFMTAVLAGPMTFATPVTSLVKTGLGNLSLNVSNLPSGAAIDVSSGGPLGLMADGTGDGLFETINVANPITMLQPVLTIGRAGGTALWNQAANKTVTLSNLTLNPGTLAAGLTITANNGYGLLLNNDIALAAGNAFNVTSALTGSNVVQGLTLGGVLSGSNAFNKSGTGVVTLTGANTFTGLVNITAGGVALAGDAALGNAANAVTLNGGPAYFRATSSFTTNRTFNFLNGTNTNNIIEVVGGETLTLGGTFGAVNGFQKAESGTLFIGSANAITGNINIAGGALRITNPGALGTTAGNTTVNNVGGAALQLALGGGTLAENLALNNTGINNGGALQAVAGANTVSGTVTLGAATTIGAEAGATLTLAGSLTGAQALTFAGAGNINFSGTLTATPPSSITQIGTGILNLQSGNSSFVGGINSSGGSLVVSGAGATGGAGAVSITPGGSILIDNSTAVLSNRFASTRAFNSTGGNLLLMGGATAVTETFAAPTFNRGQTIITVNPGAGGANLNFTGALVGGAALQNAATAGSNAPTVLFRGTNLGTGTGAGVAVIQGNFPLSGAGTLGQTNKGILPYALVDPSLSGNGISFATADTATSILRPLNTATEMVTNALTASANVRLTTANHHGGRHHRELADAGWGQPLDCAPSGAAAVQWRSSRGGCGHDFRRRSERTRSKQHAFCTDACGPHDLQRDQRRERMRLAATSASSKLGPAR
jgi:autotransporter-associated beta strand protein